LPVPDGDLYDIRLDGLHRDGFKALLNALLFAEAYQMLLSPDRRGGEGKV
jgi:hypothetical protein